MSSFLIHEAVNFRYAAVRATNGGAVLAREPLRGFGLACVRGMCVGDLFILTHRRELVAQGAAQRCEHKDPLERSAPGLVDEHGVLIRLPTPFSSYRCLPQHLRITLQHSL
jgi:hypothetical protein